MSEKKGFFKSAFDDMKESAHKQHEIDSANFNAIKEESKARLEEAKKTDPDFQEFKDAEGLVEKAKVVISHMERDGKAMAEESRENYEAMLENSRREMNDHIDDNK